MFRGGSPALLLTLAACAAPAPVSTLILPEYVLSALPADADLRLVRRDAGGCYNFVDHTGTTRPVTTPEDRTVCD